MRSLSFVGLGLFVALVVIIFSPSQKYSNALVDVSWPNCNKLTNVIYRNGIIGVNGGLDFQPNKCIDKEASSFSNYAVYINTGYPGTSYGLKFKSSPLSCSGTDYLCLGYNYGYNAALYSINYASANNIHSDFWWLDVEIDNSWTNNKLINREVLTGAVSAIKAKIFYASTGFYSVNDQWDSLTGSWHNYYPEWLGAGALTQSQAQGLCSYKSFTGAPIVLSQYTTNIDINVVCKSLNSYLISKLAE